MQTLPIVDFYDVIKTIYATARLADLKDTVKRYPGIRDRIVSQRTLLPETEPDTREHRDSPRLRMACRHPGTAKRYRTRCHPCAR